MQTNDLKALTIPEGNVLSVYTNGPGSPVLNYYPVANAFNPADYEKETEVEIVTAKLASSSPQVGKIWNATITLTDGTVGTDGYVPILYDRMNGVVVQLKFAYNHKIPERIQVVGRVLQPKGDRILDIYVITPKQKIIGPTSLQVKVK